MDKYNQDFIDTKVVDLKLFADVSVYTVGEVLVDDQFVWCIIC